VPLRVTETDNRRKQPRELLFCVSVLLGLVAGAAPASATVEQCRFIQARPEREACYQRQAIALAAKRKPQPDFKTTAGKAATGDTTTGDTTTNESLQQMRQEDDEVYRSIRGICRGC
jgi:hypothetical protein